MREENYFEKKLAICKETLAGAKTKIDDLDIQMMKLKERFEHDKKVYNDQTIHMQNIIKDMEKRIPELEKKVKEGYTTIDIRTGKSFKSFQERHIEHLKEKVEWAEANQKLKEENYKRRQELRKKKRLTPEQQELVKAEEIRIDMQGEDEIKEVHEKQVENLEKKKEDYKQKLLEEQQKLKDQLKALREVAEKAQKDNTKEKPPISEPKFVEPEDIEEGKVQDYTTLDNVIEDRELASKELREFANDLNGETEEIRILQERHPGWIEKYTLEEGGQAIWQGRITNGFRAWLISKGYKIGG